MVLVNSIIDDKTIFFKSTWKINIFQFKIKYLIYSTIQLMDLSLDCILVG